MVVLVVVVVVIVVVKFTSTHSPPYFWRDSGNINIKYQNVGKYSQNNICMVRYPKKKEKIFHLGEVTLQIPAYSAWMIDCVGTTRGGDVDLLYGCILKQTVNQVQQAKVGNRTQCGCSDSVLGFFGGFFE